jgi:uncharacterized membrane-anchored protein YhcB (DUF1043 family)
MATSEYRFTQSAPVLRELSRTTLLSPSPLVTGSSEYTENVKPFEFIDESLSLLGHLQKAQDNLIRREFEQQRDWITGKFEREQYDAGRRDQTIYQNFTKIQGQLENFKQNVRQRFEEVGQRFEEVGQRFEEVGQRFDRVETELDNFREEVGQRFDEMNARMFNSLSYRPHHQIHPVALLKNRRLQKPDAKSFPTDVKKFWRLQARENGRSNSSDRLSDFSLTLAQLISGSICCSSTPLRNTNTGIQRLKHPTLTQVILQQKA